MTDKPAATHQLTLKHIASKSGRFWENIVLVGLTAFITLALLLLILLIMHPFRAHFGTGVSADNMLINALSVVYFIANTMVAVIAILALSFAKAQSEHTSRQTDQLIEQNKHAENSRRATVYLTVSDKLSSEEIRKARHDLAQFYLTHRNGSSCKEHLNNLEQRRRRTNPDTEAREQADKEYRSYIVFLDLLEFIGVLIRKDYLHRDDFFDLMYSMIATVAPVCFKDHILERQRNEGNLLLYVNALWLMKEAVKHKPYPLLEPRENHPHAEEIEDVIVRLEQEAATG